MVSRDRSALVEALVPLARRAAELILEVYATPFEVIDKGGDDPVTLADRRANALLCEGIEALFPGVPLVAEESDPATFTRYTSAPEAFFIDPLDGTREFVARNGEFVVMVGFAEHGRATAGL
ncbi:MAG: 3'(2'),5'-bisphosphate nucleotidase CysQ, partial [Myxococcales bacterium]